MAATRTKPPCADAAITEASELTVLSNDILAYIRSTWPGSVMFRPVETRRIKQHED
jgi:hypothetical protein